MFLHKVHNACIQYLTPVGSGPPNIGDGCKINLNFEAAGDVNWRLKIRVNDTVATVAENEVQWRPDFQSILRVLKKVLSTSMA